MFPEASNKLTLRNYQLDCIKSVTQALKHGQKRVGISLATGSGKTVSRLMYYPCMIETFRAAANSNCKVIFTQLIDKIKSRPDKGDATLILAHRRELVEQAARHCEDTYPNKKIEIDMGSLHASGTADITIASVQSITSKDRINKYDPSRFKLVLVDEAHHIVARSYLTVLTHFGLNKKQADSPALVGVSATFSRFDGVKLGSAIDEIVYHKDYVDLISDKWLSDVIFTTVKSTANLSKVKSSAFGDFQTGELSKAVNTDQINDITIRSWMAKAPDRKSTLVFCVDVAHVEALTKRFREHGFDARYVTGDTPKVERSELLQSFRNGEFPVLVNCGVFTEGTDIPNIDCVILSRPTRSKNLLIQMIGRGMRLHPSKKNCHVIDLVSSLETGIVTTPTLFGLDPDALVDKASVSEMRNAKDQNIKKEKKLQEAYDRGEGPRVDSTKAIAFTDYSSVLDLIADTSGERHIRAISEYAWVQVGPERFVLSAPSGSFVRIERIAEDKPASAIAFQSGQLEKETPTYKVVEIRALPPGISKSPYAAPTQLLTATTFANAVHGADSWARHHFPHSFIHRYQSWRQLLPTQGQLDFINRLRGNANPVGLKDLNKGKAADMITKLKHGARGQFSRIEAEQRRHQKQSSLSQFRSDREKVQVGPLRA